MLVSPQLCQVKSCVFWPCQASWTPAPRNQTRTHTGSTLMCLLCESNSVIYGQPSWNRCVSNRQTSLLIKHQMALIGLEWITCLLAVQSPFWCSPDCSLPSTSTVDLIVLSGNIELIWTNADSVRIQIKNQDLSFWCGWFSLNHVLWLSWLFGALR